MDLPRWVVALVLVAAMPCGARADAGGGPSDAPRTEAEQRIDDRVQEAYETLGRASDLRLRIAFSTEGLDEHPDGTLWEHELTPCAELVEASRGSTNPIALELLLARCGAAGDRVAIARRWVDSDPQDQIAWLSLAWSLDAEARTAESRAIVLRAARASAWHGHWAELRRTIANTVPRDAPPVERYAMLIRLTSQAFRALPYPALSMVHKTCKASESAIELREPCRRFVATMVRDAEGLLEVNSAPADAALGHEESTVVRGYRTRVDALRWAQLHWTPIRDIAGVDDVDGATRALAALERMFQARELDLMDAVIADHQLRDADAARLYVVSLTPEQRARRAASPDLRAALSADSARSTTASP